MLDKDQRMHKVLLHLMENIPTLIDVNFEIQYFKHLGLYHIMQLYFIQFCISIITQSLMEMFTLLTLDLN